MRSQALTKYTTCDRKRFYSTQNEALRVARHRSIIEGFSLFAYPCRLCRGYHLTKQPQVQDIREEQRQRLEQRVHGENIVRTLLNAALERKFS